MTRRGIIGLLFGSAAVAQERPYIGPRVYTCRDTVPPCETVNNRCPLCGEMAEQFKRPTYQKQKGLHLNRGSDVITIEVEYIPTGPTSNLTRCKRCNVAFWQDCEAGEEKVKGKKP